MSHVINAELDERVALLNEEIDELRDAIEIAEAEDDFETEHRLTHMFELAVSKRDRLLREPTDTEIYAEQAN